MKKIFVAEDDNFLANAYRVKLTKAGFEVFIAGDGNELIAELQKGIPDLILLDLIMPVKDGFTTLQEIKANSAWVQIPVIVASNLGQKEDIDKAMQLGAKDFIIKSDLSMADLIIKINTILQ
jgi:two-component system alkaline phosphatase synthesis response regulator PhoP